MRFEKPRRVVIVERKPRRATVERVGRQIGVATEDPGLEMCIAVAAISQRPSTRSRSAIEQMSTLESAPSGCSGAMYPASRLKSRA